MRGLVIGVGVLLGCALTAAGQETGIDDERQERLMERYEKMVNFNLKTDHALPEGEIDSLMRSFEPLRLGDRIAAWADYFHQRGDAAYKFGLEEGGYAHDGRLVDDFSTDCILFFYRVTELGRSASALEAVQFAFGTRFYGATLEEVVSEDGRVDYDNPVHLDYSIDIIRSGIWGSEVTEHLGHLVRDMAGSSRYEKGTVRFVPTEKILFSSLRSGDIIFFVSNEETSSGRAVRESGAIIAHVGIVRVEDGEAYLIHPAAKPLPGVYEGGKVEKVLLKAYLRRIENFKGIKVCRVENF